MNEVQDIRDIRDFSLTPPAVAWTERDVAAFTGLGAEAPATQVLGKIDTPRTIVGNAGLNVIRLDSISLSSGALVLRGSANDEFIINISGTLKLSGGSAITLSGGLLPSRVLFNLQYGGADVALSGEAA